MARLKGQETELSLVVSGSTLAQVNKVKSLELNFDFEILREGYLGQTTDEFDYVFNGCTGKMELHIANIQTLSLVRAILEVARSRVAGARINAKTALNLPDGSRPLIVVPNLAFGPMPLSFGKRNDFVNLSLDFACGDPRLLGVPSI